ncbi:hypothetical protein Pan241w_38040 [Gimesia alba]|uniref:Thiol:disulfide interchange protein DsbD N-terminal domain-containing protein n=1 Tax=Gimesia alba TaxID=2527973 RepID=A0A517RIL0_9PLAN|nr:hypothetical protein Pan241w_38040 [Gimesia alba]
MSLLLILYLGLSLLGCEKPVEQQHDVGSSPSVDLAQTKITEVERRPTELTHRVEGKPVSVTLRVPKSHVKPGETIELSVLFEIAPLWEIRTMDAQPADLATRLELDLPAGLQSTGKWLTPEPERSMSLDRHPAYMGKIEVRQKILVEQSAQPGEKRISCSVSYQACDEQRCLKPAAVKLQVSLVVEANK